MKATLSNSLSVYLDGLRLLAAFMVFLAHSHNFLIPSLNRYLAGYGAEAVAVFFVLSGFVIAFVRNEKEHDATSYVVARLSRIYSVAIPAILVTIIVDAIGTHFAREQYTLFNDKFDFYRDIDVRSLLAYLTFTNQIWFSHAIFGTLEPYWSLGFEVWYYILFGLYTFTRGRVRWLALGAAALVCGLNILLYLPLWLLGCGAYHLVSQKNMGRWPATALFLLSILTAGAVLYGRWHFGAMTMFEAQSLTQELRNAVYFHVIGVCIAANIVAFHFMTQGWSVWSPATAIRWTAGASFTLYLVHQPIEVMISSLMPWIRSDFAYGLAAVAATLGAVLLLAELGERRKRIVSVWMRTAIQKTFMLA